ncbi:MAG: hypothetical protein ACT6SC_11840, partial [Blastomonas fulva]
LAHAPRVPRLRGLEQRELSMSCGVDSAFWANTRRHLIRYGRAGVMLGIEGDAPDLHALSQALSVELPLAAWLTPGQTAEGRHAGGFF